MSSKKQVFENSTPIKTGHHRNNQKSKFQKLNSSKTSLDDLTNENAQVPNHLSCDTTHQQPIVPSISPTEQSINDSLNEDSVLNDPNYHQMYQEINVNTTGVYDCNTVPVQISSPYYVYQSPYTAQPEYVMNTPQQNCNLYQAYVYDPNLGAYTLNTYSPMQQQQVSSPQQASTLGSYQTPRQPQNIYNMVNNCMSPMESSVPSSESTNTNSPCQYQYVMYPPQNPYLSPMAPQPYMMYQPPAQQTPNTEHKFKPRKYKKNAKTPNHYENQAMDQQADHDVGQYMDGMYPSPVSMCSPQVGENPYGFCDPNGVFNLQGYYDYVNNGIQSFGDDDDDNEENLNDEETEQLACYTCRGRRMCFCYFLKVRYYKFPSFLDLVDHQYKKWRQNMIKAKKSN